MLHGEGSSYGGMSKTLTKGCQPSEEQGEAEHRGDGQQQHLLTGAAAIDGQQLDDATPERPGGPHASPWHAVRRSRVDRAPVASAIVRYHAGPADRHAAP